MAVKVNQQVSNGDLLMIIDNTDLMLDLKRKELEVLKLENVIKEQKQNYKPLQLPDIEREVQLAKANVDYAKKIWII